MLAFTVLPVALASLSALFASSAGAMSSLQARQYQDPNSQLVVDSPSCDYYRCIVTWTHGDSVNINFYNAPTGMVSLAMMVNENTEVAYQIANISSPSQPGYCDAGNGVGVVVAGKSCGRFAFTVPSEWSPGRNYSVRAQLIGNTSVESYTDVVQIKAASGDPEPSRALSTVAVDGAPSSTSGDVSASQTVTVTAATTPGGAAPTSASSASSGASSGSAGSNMASSASSGSSSLSAQTGAASAGTDTTNGATTALSAAAPAAVALTAGASLLVVGTLLLS